MFNEKERAMFNLLLKAFRDNDGTNGPGLLEAVKAYTGAVHIYSPVLSSELIIDYGYYKIVYSIPTAYIE